VGHDEIDRSIGRCKRKFFAPKKSRKKKTKERKKRTFSFFFLVSQLLPVCAMAEVLRDSAGKCYRRVTDPDTLVVAGCVVRGQWSMCARGE
jgi:hypothetical protein